MAEISSGLRGLTAKPWAYSFLQKVWGAEAIARRFVDQNLNLNGGERVLDIGCGTAFILRFLPPVQYIGFDPNADYIASAREQYGDRGTFYPKTFDEADIVGLAPVDLVIITAVLHHLDDDEVLRLLSLLKRVLKSDGRIVTLDPVLTEPQNPIARFLISMDRGQNVRYAREYQGLLESSFSEVTGRIQTNSWPPYTYWIMTASNAKLSA